MPNNIRVYSAGPLTIFALIVVIGLVIIVVPLLFLGLAGKAITNLVGLSWLTATALVILILLCSLVNLPVWKVRRETIRMPHTGPGSSRKRLPREKTAGSGRRPLRSTWGERSSPSPCRSTSCTARCR